MSEFKFLCPACGQKISCDATLSGTQIACPVCQKTLTIPAAAGAVPAMAAQSAPVPIAVGSAPPPVPVRAPAAPRPQPSPSASPAAKAAERNRYSGLAIASLICSVFVFFGFIPGIICGHMAKARMRKDIFLVGEKMANAGLIISYCVLAATLCFSAMYLGVWWHFHPVRTVLDSPNAEAAPAVRVVDEVKIKENEDDHDLNGSSTDGTPIVGKAGRRSVRSGYFSYTMKVLPQEPMTLICRYWGGEPKGRLFDIAIDDQVIATQELFHNVKDKFFDLEYKIPAALTRGKDHVTVEFQAHPTWTAGTLYGCEMLKR